MTRSITIAVVGSPGVAPELGKKGTASDLTLYNAVRDDHALTVIEPTRFPEKFAALLFSLAMADAVVVIVRQLNRDVAETLAAVDQFSKPSEIWLAPEVGEADVRRILKGLGLAEAPIHALDILALRAELGERSAAERPGVVRVPIDHAFPVKGVGAVALGIVAQGRLVAHDKLELFPLGRTVDVRSIQVHDVEVPQATSSERVGVALRGVEADELERGQVLAPAGALQFSAELTLHEVTASPYYRGDLAAGGAGHALVGLQFVPARATAVADGSTTLTLDRTVAYGPAEPVWVADLSVSTGPRLAYRGRL
ncbi:MAG: EF-Tu/IF-2/RF-3 family GTPase [Thermoplasmata archaeon]